MKRWIGWLSLLLLGCAGAVQASGAGADIEHERGDFRFFTGPVPGFVVPQDIPADWDARAPGAGETVWRVWLYDTQADRRTGQDLEYTDYAYQPRSTANLGDAGRFQVTFNPEYQRLVLHAVRVRRDGTWQERLDPTKVSLARREAEFENDLYDGSVTALVVLDDVRVDDVVRVTYTITGSNPILDGQVIDGVSVAWGSPLLHAHARVLYDPGTEVVHRGENDAPVPLIRVLPDAVEAVVDRRGNPSVVDEDGYPAWFRPYPRVQIAAARSWADVVAWALPLYPRVDKLPADLEARIDAWARLPDPHRRLRAALRAVQDEVRYFGVEMGSNTHRPSLPAETWLRRYGDCKDKAYLLSVVLGLLGVEAVPALVSTARGRAILDFVPSASVFNHVIVRARIGNDIVWVDPTMRQQGGDPRSTDLSRYGAALPVAEGTAAPETIAAPASPETGVAAVERFKPAADDKLRLEIETVYRGASADAVRANVSASRIDDMQRRYAEYYRKRFGDLQVLHPPRIADDREANVLKIDEAYLLKAPFVQEDGNIRALDVYGETIAAPSRLPTRIARSGPLELAAPGHYRHEVTVESPQGWLALSSEAREAFDSPAFAYHRSVERDGTDVRVVYEIDITRHEVDAAGAGAHLEEMRRVRDTLAARLRFRTPAPELDASEREARLKALLHGVLDDAGGDQ